MCDVMLPEQLIYHVTKSIWSTYGTYLKEPRKKEQLSIMSGDLCKTAMTPLSSSSSTEEWMQSISGNRLRWEILGNIFSVFGLSVMTNSDWDPLFAIANNGNPYNKRVWRENEGVYGGMPGFV